MSCIILKVAKENARLQLYLPLVAKRVELKVYSRRRKNFYDSGMIKMCLGVIVIKI